MLTVPAMTGSARQSVYVCRIDELRPGQTRKFQLRWRGRETEAFAVNHRGALRAYVNSCVHVPMPMDWVENQFLTDDRQHILCATHGAYYRPEDGLCVAGPGLGKSLTPVPLSQVGDAIYASPPEIA